MKKPVARIFLHHPECSVQSGAGIYEALDSAFDLGFFQTQDIKESFFKKIDMVIFPGGLGDSDTYDKLLRPTEDVIKNLVDKGKSYLGVCMGAYWAGPFYYNIVDGIEPVQYIKRPGADILRSFGTTTRVTWNNKPQDMFFYDGCSLLGDKEKFNTIATYSNGDAMAVIQNRTGLIGCHPESMPSWYSKPYMKKSWHNYEHHKLLLDFALKLIN